MKPATIPVRRLQGRRLRIGAILGTVAVLGMLVNIRPASASVVPAATSTSLANLPNPSTFGQGVALSATIFSTNGSVPTGSVSFDEHIGLVTSNLGSATVTPSGPNGVASISFGTLSVGTHTITATYNGDSLNLTSTSSTVTQTVNKAATATALVSSLNPSTSGNSVTFTATVSSAGGTPTGTVTFDDGAGLLGLGTLDGTGTATFTTSGLALGAHTITAIYGGDSNFTTSTSTAVNQTVLAPSSTTLAAAPNPSTYGASVTLTATVSGSSGTPTGTVTFKNGGSAIGSPVAVDGTGKATLSSSALATGGHVLTAMYSGDTAYAGSTSSPVTQGVSQATPTVALSASANPSPFGTQLDLTTTVTGPAGATAAPSGTVTVKDGSTVVGTATVSGGHATVSTSTLVVGVHNLTSHYAGDTNYSSGVDASLSETVSKAATITALGAAPSPGVSGQSVTLTATVTGSGGTPGGSVTFKDGSTTLGGGPVALNAGGTATLSISTLTPGAHSLTAVYFGDGTYLTSTSSTTSETILDLTTTSLISSVSPTVFGEAVTFTAAVAGQTLSSTPTGTVTFFDGATQLGAAVALDGTGHAARTTSALAVGDHAITAVYAGDGSFAGSTSSALPQTVGQANTTTALGSSVANPSTLGAVTFTATVSASAPGAGTPTGTLAFSDGGTTIAGCSAQPLTAGTATCTVTYDTAGAHDIATTYSGDTDFTAGTQGTLTQTMSGAGGVTVTLHSHALAANGSATTQVYAQLTDQQGNHVAIAGYTVTFTSNGGLTFTDASGATVTNTAVTDATGLATVKVVASTHAGTVIITATTADTPALTATDHLKLTGSHFATTSLSQSRIAANGTSTSVATAQVVDGAGNPVSGEVVAFSSSGATVAQPFVVTDASGNASDTVTSSTTPQTLPVALTDSNFVANPTTTLALTLLPAANATNSSFIHNAYVTMLGRDADGPALTYWLGLLNAGTPRSALATALAHSAEYRLDVIGGTPTIQGFYLEYLGRPSDASGAAYWVSRMASGTTFEQVRLAFIGSPEYFIHHNSDPGQTIDALYLDVLGRSDSTDPAGKAYWLSHFNVNTIAAQFLFSYEGRAHLVITYYASILNRTFDAAGLDYWTRAILGGASDENVIADFLGSTEYFLSH